MIKSLHFRKLYWYDDENVKDERVDGETACSSSRVQLPRGGQSAQRAIHSQSKWQMHAWGNYKRINSHKKWWPHNKWRHAGMGQEGRVHRAQAAVLNMLTESRQFDKVKISKKTNDGNARAPVSQTMQWQLCRYCGGILQPRQCPMYGKMCAGCGKVGHLKKVQQQKKQGGKWNGARDASGVQWRWGWKSEY